MSEEDSRAKFDADVEEAKVDRDRGFGEEEESKELFRSFPWAQKLLNWGVESRGIVPVLPEERQDVHHSKIMFIWLSANLNILTFSSGTLGPVVYGLGLRDACLTILFFNLLCSMLPAYLTTWGPHTGMRQMCQSRYSFGYFGTMIPTTFNLATLAGYCILNSIVSGQALSSVSNDHLSWSVGIVVICIISLLVSFCGYQVLNWYERLAWIPPLITFVVAVGVGGKHFTNPPPAAPATASAVLSFAATLAGFVIPYVTMASDFTLYYTPSASSWKIFLYSYLGFNIPIITLQCLGAAAVIAAQTVPSWNAGYADGNVGGLIAAMLGPTGNFGKFLMVLLSLSVPGNIAPTFYSMCMSFQVLIPPLVVVPRYVFSVLAVAIIIPVSIVGSHRFYDTLTNFLGLISYWASAFAAVVIVEHVVIRRNDFSTYDLGIWNKARLLPSGVAGLAACALACGLIVPSMDQVWFVGPFAKTTGDIGFELAFASTAVFYIPLRYVELRYRKL